MMPRPSSLLRTTLASALLALCAVPALAAEAAKPAFKADPAKGQALAKVCTSCHALEKGGPNKIGPGLWGVIGHKIGTHEGFNYSAAFKERAAKGETWTFESLNKFIENPKGYISGTAMGYAGLKEADRIGANPFRFGFIASTDTHNGTPGAVDEDAYVGHVGREEGDALARLTGEVPAGPRNGPGGLVAVWATENSRDAIFDALRRREAYGTSGPRIAVRVFGGAALPEDLCERGDPIALADELGVPMGGVLSNDGEGPPRMLVSALRDPQGLPLQRAQVIKG